MERTMNTATATGSQTGRGDAARNSRNARQDSDLVTRRIKSGTLPNKPAGWPGGPRRVDQPSTSPPRTIRAPRGNERTCKSWAAEAAMRMLMNNLDPEVAERPQDLVVYGGRGQAARNWQCFDAIIETLRRLKPDETLLVQSGKPVGVVKTHEDAPRVLLANSNLVPHWAT